MKPTLPAGEPVDKTLTVVSHYRYRTRTYEPSVVIERPVPAGQERFDTPETAMITRISAMMRGDYDAWLATWDERSRQLTLAANAEEGRSAEEFLQWWGDLFQFARVVLVRRVETGEYVVVTYRWETPSGEDAGSGLELPVVFRRVDDRWLATLDLAADPLVPASPWVTGERRLERVIP